jgi:C1A family cysteine protease
MMPLSRDANLPKKVDWRGTLVDTGIKDQGFCGSCWSFAATGAMEAAWYLATGESLSFSQQQIVVGVSGQPRGEGGEGKGGRSRFF